MLYAPVYLYIIPYTLFYVKYDIFIKKAFYELFIFIILLLKLVKFFDIKNGQIPLNDLSTW